ncbi:glycosyltransferase [Dactylosporangium siamense]|uniref:Glycosyltransferase n=1 Tax=Dactylosporangium siamense TaxID=685454 RepID=A0A919UH24_9ACTN|nr:glycosyltransferase [Dactylosporangium siamense]GIG50263.1 hypothetical protein Dsi01nite_083040 [Dactylosporangium siamense]
MSRLIMVAKSLWHPSIRREHALATEACSHGVEVTFIEAPSDVRSVRVSTTGPWLRGLCSATPRQLRDGLDIVSRSTLAPGHRHSAAASADNALLRRQIGSVLSRSPRSARPTVVVNLPWQWPATARLPIRRIFDAADDWDALLGGSRPHVRAMYHRIADEADAIIVANPTLRDLFPGRTVELVANGTPADLVVDAVRPRPHDRRLVYAGTLSHRFDVDLIRAVLDLLPGWRLDLYGESRYPGHRDEPAREFRDLLRQCPDRIRWHGVLDRDDLGQAIDAADVAVVPHRAAQSRGQSSMKLADYAARGRPIVSTGWDTNPDAEQPPNTWMAANAEEFAAAVVQAYADAGDIDGAVAWARQRTWPSRWPLWSAAAFGSQPVPADR